MKALRIIGRSFRDAFKSVFRNFSLSMASILCATITLLVVAVSLIIAGNVEDVTKNLEKELTIVVYLERNATEEDAKFIENSIKAINNVSNVTYKSKEEWKNEMSEYNSSYGSIFDNYSENPLPDSFVVYVNDVNSLEKVTSEIKKLDKIDSAGYGKDAVTTIVSVFDFVEKITVVIVIALIFVTAFLITNTIKLTIYSRRNEIEIMRLVGSSNTAIKLPFVIEGFVIGILGSIIPIILTIYGYIIAYEKLNGHIYVELIKLISPYNFVFYISLIIMALGALIGMLGSLFCFRLYLRPFLLVKQLQVVKH